jgi:predicted lipid-binding transport protein (Tim44 family)
MGKWLLALSVAALGTILVINDADARRIGGGRSLGVQRNVTAPPAKQAQPQQAQPQQQAPQGNRWAGILGGLAIGGLLGYLFGGNGLLGLLLLAVLALGIGFALRAALRRREEARPLQLAGMGNETLVAQPQAGAPAVAGAAVRIPAGFDMTGFLRTAKMQFIRLQAANDTGRVDEIREFTTPEMFEELRAELQPGSHTDVVALNADLLELAQEKDSYWASVRFSGTVREDQGAEPVGFEEVWNLVKPADGSSGWLLAGIQQMH